MAVSKTKEWRMQAAKLAKAYMAGGDAPYQAARKTGFMRVGIMEEAIKELEKEQGKEEYRQEVEAQVMGAGKIDANEVEGKIEPVLAAEYKNVVFCVREYEPKDGKDGMVRIWAGARTQYIWSNINHVPMLIDLLKNVMAGGEMKPGTNEKNEIIREKDEQIKMLQRELVETMDLLKAERERNDAVLLGEQITAMQKKIEMEERLNQRLKDKIVEMVLDF